MTTTKPKPVFYCLLRGLRGGYMPDEARHEAARTFEEFSASVTEEVEFYDLAWNLDQSKTTEHGMLDALLREAWQHAQTGQMELCIAVGVERDDDETRVALNRSYGLTVSQSDARDYLAFRREVRHA